jgi:hypothetical protein
MELAQYYVQWRDLVTVVLNFRDPLLVSYNKIISFSLAFLTDTSLLINCQKI